MAWEGRRPWNTAICLWLAALLTLGACAADRNPLPSDTMVDQLSKAAARGDTDSVLQLLEDGADVNERDADGRTPVMTATRGNHVETVRALIEAGADIDLQDDRWTTRSCTPAPRACWTSCGSRSRPARIPTITNRFGGTALIPASERGHVEVVEELLTRTQVDIDHVNNLGWTALLEAIVLSSGDERHQRVVQLLVDHGADITIADKDGVTPLQHAQARGFTQIERILDAAAGS